MKTIIRGISALIAGALLAATAGAHHSAVAFDFGKSVSYTGVVKSFAAINPHMRLVVELKNATGSGTHTVNFEGHSTNNMYRSGYRKGMVNVGDTITVNAAPFKDGTEGGYVISAKLSDGRFFGMQSRAAAGAPANAAEQKAIGEEVRKAAEGR
jgi:hypothetical protein